jgi:hypothetical protein
MSTRSFVGVMIGDECHSVYVHCDGYLSGVGAELQEYTTQAEVEELISRGDRSTLTDGFYSDRNEDWEDVKPRAFSTFAEFYEYCDDSWGEYYYIFKDGVWYCGTTYAPNLLLGEHPLAKKLTPYSEAVKVCKTF